MEISDWWNTFCCHNCKIVFAIKADTDTTERAACPKCKEIMPVTEENMDFVER